VLPTPGGKAPEWIRDFMTLKTPYVPFAIVLSIARFAVPLTRVKRDLNIELSLL